MRYLSAVAGLTAVLSIASVGGQTPRVEIEHSAAFARLCGVLRYFYPSDAAAGLDWNRFAVHAVRLAREAPDAKSLKSALESLASPLGPGIEK